MLKYGNCVRVTSGFYEGMEGTVIHESASKEGSYIIELPHWREGSIAVTFDKSDLEFIK